VLASTALSALFVGELWFIIASGAVITATGTGALTRLRPLPVPACLAAEIASLALYLNLIFEARHSLLWVIPTPGSVSRLVELVRSGISDAKVSTAPAPNLAGLLLLAAGGVGIAAVLTDLLAVRLRSTALAGLPLLALLGVPVIIRGGHDQFVIGLAFCLGGTGYLALLAADGRVSSRAAALPMTALAGLASIALAVCAPMLLPRLDFSSLFFQGAAAGGLAQTTAQLHEHPTVVFRYTTTASPSLQQSDPQYFQQYVFDTLGDAGWQVAGYPPGVASARSIPQPPGLTDLPAAQPMTTTVTTTRDFSATAPAFLPLPYPVIRLTVPSRWQLMVDPDLMVYSTTGSLAGQTYAAVSYAVNPSQAQLEAVPALTGLPSLAPDLQLPPAYRTAALEQLAHEQTAGQSTEYGKVDALATWLSAPPFRYSLSAAQYHSPAGLFSFLTATKTGYCVQYAYAMTVLTRLLGIPARFVTGYTAGTPGRIAGSYVVKTSDAHAWTEVYFPTLGWIRFEPTPAGQDGTASRPDYMTASGNRTSEPGQPVIVGAAGSASVPVGPHANFFAERHSLLASGPRPATHGEPTQTTGRAAVLSGVAAAAFALLTPAAIRLTRRQRRWLLATSDAARAHAAWREFRDDLTDFGLGARPGEPPRTLADRVSAGLAEPAGAAVRRLALAEERASYAARPCASRHLRRDGASARRGLADAVRRGTRWRARVFPASLLRRHRRCR
jgi:transglutaminase-like putative cysteine protease